MYGGEEVPVVQGDLVSQLLGGHDLQAVAGATGGALLLRQGGLRATQA